MWRLYFKKNDVPFFFKYWTAPFKAFQSFRWRNNASRTANTTPTKPKLSLKKNDEFVSVEHLILAILILKPKQQILKDQGVTEKD
jgi:hypothetical protein